MTSPVSIGIGARGPHVRWIQRALNVRGDANLTVDGIYGPLTEAAVVRMSGAAVVGESTIRTLARVLRPDRAALAYLLAEIARTQIGVRETSRNRGPEVDQYIATTGLDPYGAYPWCAAFVVWCLERLRSLTHIERTWIRSARVVDHYHAGLKQQMLTSPMRGRICIARRLDHMGIVYAVATRVIGSIEGNTNASGFREGDSVLIKRRPREYWGWYVDYFLYEPRGGE